MAQKTSGAWFAAPPATDSGESLPDWYLELRRRSWERFLETPDPDRRREDWRFADLKKVRFTGMAPAEPMADPSALIERALAGRPGRFAAHFVFVNNLLVHSETGALPEGALCLPLDRALAEHGDLVREHFMQEDRNLGGEKFAALHGAATLGGLFIHFPAGCVCEAPVLTHHYSGGDLTAVFPHMLVVAEDNASVSVAETFESVEPERGDRSLAVAMTDLYADRGGRIQYVALQDAADRGAKHVQLHSSRTGRDAKVKTAFLNLGASWVRNESVNRMLEPGAESRILGASLAKGIQEYDQRTLQSHEAQHTFSDLLFKNALYDEARTIFSGLIQVHPGAHHTDSFQSCRNLLGSDRAEANAMPGLEIDADQVRCSHGATSGRISEEEIFYLRSRGISETAARQMISLGFLNEAVEQLEGDDLREHFFERIERKFSRLPQE